MTRSSFAELCETLKPYLEKKDTVYRKAISLGKRIAVVLYFLKGGADYGTISDLFGVGQSTVACLVKQFCEGLINEHQNLVNFPDSEDEKANIAARFFEKWQYYDCFGSLDGTHIPILPPQKNAADYYCYKSFHSINVLALADDQYMFR